MVGTLRNMYSSNRMAMEYVQRIHTALTKADNILQLVAIRSVDNGADAASRDLPDCASTISRCLRIIDEFDSGCGMTCARTASYPPMGGMRHCDGPKVESPFNPEDFLLPYPHPEDENDSNN